jgi:hypothetical protein
MFYYCEAVSEQRAARCIVATKKKRRTRPGRFCNGFGEEDRPGFMKCGSRCAAVRPGNALVWSCSTGLQHAVARCLLKFMPWYTWNWRRSLIQTISYSKDEL